jgi:D-alanine-D-alanine ligase
MVEDPTTPLRLYVLPPGERVFDTRVPSNERFLAYERYWELPEEQRRIPAGEPYYWYRSAPDDLREEIATLARRAVRAVDGAGYARVDIRRSERLGKLFVLEVNAQCGLSTDDSSTVGSLLNLAGRTMPEMMELVLDHALGRARHPNGKTV